VNLLGLVAGIDVRNLAFKVPGFGDIGWPHETATAAPRAAK
jgi:hypothetical protein